MFTIDLSIKNTAFSVSVQRKTAEDAEAIYQLILAAMRSGNPDIVELKCEGKTEKKVAVRSSEISGVQIVQKDGANTSSGRPPGFFAVTAE
jgi:vacuolar-type H+-ATPase subunit D/Vma8